MVDINKAILVHHKIGSQNFEILVETPEKAIEFRQGKRKLDEVLVTNDIFSDVKRGTKASEHEMEKLFGTNDKNKIAEIILKNGEVQLTTEYKNKLRDEKRLQIVNLIHRNAIDPKTNLPHPPQRIQNAFDEAKVNIGYFKSAESQVQEIIKKINTILPIKYEIREISIRVPAQFSGQSFAVMKRFGKLLEEKWENDGSLVAIVEVPAGLQSDMFNELNHLTKGSIETKTIKTK